MTEATKWVVEDSNENGIFWPSEELKKKAWVNDESIYEMADKNPVAFWAQLANRLTGMPGCGILKRLN